MTFDGTLQAFATAVAVGQLANGGILRFIRMAIVRTADHGTLYRDIEECPHRLLRRARDSEAVL